MHSNHDSDACDESRSIAELKRWVDVFAEERNWAKFHSPKNLSISIAIEAAELMEHFQWLEREEVERISSEQKEKVGEEMADVLSYLLRLSSVLEVDLTDTLRRKMLKNALKYPV